MSLDLHKFEEWEFGAIGISNPKTSPLKRYFELIPATSELQGDIGEFGVSRGNSLITTSLLSLETDNRIIYGFDTFSGFPSYSNFDNFDFFKSLHEKNKITDQHYQRILKNRRYVSARGDGIKPNEISNSKDFSATSVEIVQKKIEFFSLQDKIKIVVGDFTENLTEKIKDISFSLILIDSDLYDSYHLILPLIWEKLVPGGYIYLDEYYSLKFPGPRLAVDNFIEKSDSTLIKLIKLPNWMDFERWALHKPQ